MWHLSMAYPLTERQPRTIELPGEDIDAVGCFLEFLYTGDYFPKKVPGQRQLEKDPSIPDVDMTGDQLLKHAKVYTLAEKFGLVHLKNLASSKIHCVNSTAKGEIAYARYVYEFTPKNDTTIRAPVANFWATRSHTLRAEAEEEFRSLCLEFPQFGYDVLSEYSWALIMLYQTANHFFPHSARPRRETQARAQRKDASGSQQRPQAPPTQQHYDSLERRRYQKGGGLACRSGPWSIWLWSGALVSWLGAAATGTVSFVRRQRGCWIMGDSWLSVPE